jgi:hypothetical protein
VGNAEGISRATIALQSLTGMLIYETKAASVGIPLDLDGMAFWAHSFVYKPQWCILDWGNTNDEWELNFEVWKEYLRYFERRYKLFTI